MMVQVGRVPPPGSQRGFCSRKGRPGRHASRLSGVVVMPIVAAFVVSVNASIRFVIRVIFAGRRLREGVVTGVGGIVRVEPDSIDGRPARFTDPLQGAVTAFSVTVIRHLRRH